jgi:tetratricopeptide (TPR) repeat protein
MATEWYRCESWTQAEEQQFFAKLSRARKDGRSQYLRIQAVYLIERGDLRLLDVAESLLNKILTEYPDDRLETSPALTMLGRIYRTRGNNERALDYFKQAIDFEKEFPNVIWGASLSFAEIVVEDNRTEWYDEVQKTMLAEIKNGGLLFPTQWYTIASVLCVIYASKGDREKVKFYAYIAERNATAKRNSLWNPRKKKLGLVEERNALLDRKVRRALRLDTR